MEVLTAAALKRPASEARQRHAADAGGYLYVAELANSAIRKISPDGVVSTFAGVAGNPGSADGLGDSRAVPQSVGPGYRQRRKYFLWRIRATFTIRRVTPSGQVETYAGAAGSIGCADGPRAEARFWEPHGVAFDRAGNL